MAREEFVVPDDNIPISQRRRPTTESSDIPTGVQTESIPAGEEGRRVGGMSEPESGSDEDDSSEPDKDGNDGMPSVVLGDTPGDFGGGDGLMRNDPYHCTSAKSPGETTLSSALQLGPNFLPHRAI